MGLDNAAANRETRGATLLDFCREQGLIVRSTSLRGAVPAGALAGIVDPRKFLIVVEILYTMSG